ncbi:hypothetical protein BOX15_Mlig017661g1, partial [Macrostomum lignano]
GTAKSASPMKQGIHSRLLPPESCASAFEALYRLRRRLCGGPTSVVAAFSAVDDWRIRVVEYALPDCCDSRGSNWQPEDGDTLCTAFTDINSRFTFLFAVFTRLHVEADCIVECLALVTRRPGFDIFPALLRQLSSQWPVDPVLAISQQLAASATMGQPTGHRDSQLPDTGRWGPVRELSDRLGRSSDTLLYLLTAMLTERKLLLVARRLDRLTLCAFGCVSMLYPFSWEHVFAPSLSAANIDHIGCLVPCVFGLVEALYVTNRAKIDANFADRDFALVNLDSGDLFVADGAEVSAEQLGLPKRLVRAAKRSLSRSRSSSAPGDAFSQALLRVTVELLAPIRQQPAGSEFNLDAFLAASPESHRPFLRRLSGSQLFHEFADRYLAAGPSESHYDAFNRAADRLLASHQRKRAIVNLPRNIGRRVRSNLLSKRLASAHSAAQQLPQKPELIGEKLESDDDAEEDEAEEGFEEADGVVKSLNDSLAPTVMLNSGVGGDVSEGSREGVLISIDDSDSGSNNNDAASLHSAASSSHSIGGPAHVHFVSPPSTLPPRPQQAQTDSIEDWSALIGDSVPAPAPESSSETDLLQFSSPFKAQILSRYGTGVSRPASFPIGSAATGMGNNWVSFT